MQAICSKVENFVIENNRFDIISANNILQFLTEENALKLIQDIKEKIKKGGYVLISAFTVQNPTYKIVEDKKNRMHFELQEMKKLFHDFEIIYYFEGLVDDEGHTGQPMPHQHGIVRMIAQKGGIKTAKQLSITL